jgi:hypothetical protein
LELAINSALPITLSEPKPAPSKEPVLSGVINKVGNDEKERIELGVFVRAV